MGDHLARPLLLPHARRRRRPSSPTPATRPPATPSAARRRISSPSASTPRPRLGRWRGRVAARPRGPGEFEIAGAGIPASRRIAARRSGLNRGRNIAYVIELEDVRIGHLGRHRPRADVRPGRRAERRRYPARARRRRRIARCRRRPPRQSICSSRSSSSPCTTRPTSKDDPRSARPLPQGDGRQSSRAPAEDLRHPQLAPVGNAGRSSSKSSARIAASAARLRLCSQL